MEYKHEDIQLIDACLNAVYGYPGPRDLENIFLNEPKGTQNRIQILMQDEKLIQLERSQTKFGRFAARITDNGNIIKAKYGSFRKYWEHKLEIENEIKRKAKEAEEREERAIKANEKSARFEGLNAYIALGALVVSIFAAWQTFEVSEKKRIIEIQEKHIDQLENQIKKSQPLIHDRKQKTYYR